MRGNFHTLDNQFTKSIKLFFWPGLYFLSPGFTVKSTFELLSVCLAIGYVHPDLSQAEAICVVHVEQVEVQFVIKNLHGITGSSKVVESVKVIAVETLKG